MTLPAIHTYPDVQADWDVLADEAATLKSEAASVQTAMEDAHSGWKRLRWCYEHEATQDQVWTGLDGLVPHAEEWASALADAQTAIEDFVTTGRPLQTERESLDRARPDLISRRSQALTSDDETFVEEVSGQIRAYNVRAVHLDSNWNLAQETLTLALERIKTGTRVGLPATGGKRDPETNALDWASMTSELDTKFGAIDPNQIWDQLVDLDDEQLREWLEANPEAARALAENSFPGIPRPGSPEAIMAAAMENDAQFTEQGVAEIRAAWDSLDPDQQRRMMLLYPGVIGNLNGIPLATRGQTNQVTVAGLREQTVERLAGLGNEPRLEDYLNEHGDYETALALWSLARNDWENERERLTTVQSGLDQAWAAMTRPQHQEPRQTTPGYSTIFVSTEGNGQIATMRGAPGPNTQRVATFIPGTFTTIASVDHYNDALDAIDGDGTEGTVSIYWQGADLPQSLLGDNMGPEFNEAGAPRLAAFDYALDLDVPPTARTTYVGHSAGASLLGTAEREGLDSTVIAYVAPAGVGHEVGSPDDTANPDAHRYWVQTRDDPISLAQGFGGGAHGPSWWEGSNPSRQMGATRLESGFMPDGTLMGAGGGFEGGHNDYFTRHSTSALNLQAVIRGEDVSLYVEPGVQYTWDGPVLDEPIRTDPRYGPDRLTTFPVPDLEN